MSIQIIKAGILDRLQGLPGTGKQHQGFSPGGSMDTIAHLMANALVGNKRDAIVLEMHIPAAIIVFNKEILFTFTGAVTSATLDNETVYSNQPIIVNAGSKLTCNPSTPCNKALAANSGALAPSDSRKFCNRSKMTLKPMFISRRLKAAPKQ